MCGLLVSATPSLPLYLWLVGAALGGSSGGFVTLKVMWRDSLTHLQVTAWLAPAEGMIMMLLCFSFAHTFIHLLILSLTIHLLIFLSNRLYVYASISLLLNYDYSVLFFIFSFCLDVLDSVRFIVFNSSIYPSVYVFRYFLSWMTIFTSSFLLYVF